MTNLTHKFATDNSLLLAHDQWSEHPNGVKSTFLLRTGEILRRTITRTYDLLYSKIRLEYRV